jgi:hypothetical protein
MISRVRSRMTYANVIASLALFIALGGSSYAAFKLPRNTVGNVQLKSNAVTSAKVRDGALKKVDFASGQLPKGDKGDKGDPGTPGTPGATGTFTTATARSVTATADMTANQKVSYTATCPAGQLAIAGGGRGDDQTSELTQVTSSRPALSTTTAPGPNEPPPEGGTFDGWRITVQNVGANPNIRPTVWVVCVPAP